MIGILITVLLIVAIIFLLKSNKKKTLEINKIENEEPVNDPRLNSLIADEIQKLKRQQEYGEISELEYEIRKRDLLKKLQ